MTRCRLGKKDRRQQSHGGQVLLASWVPPKVTAVRIQFSGAFLSECVELIERLLKHRHIEQFGSGGERTREIPVCWLVINLNARLVLPYDHTIAKPLPVTRFEKFIETLPAASESSAGRERRMRHHPRPCPCGRNRLTVPSHEA